MDYSVTKENAVEKHVEENTSFIFSKALEQCMLRDRFPFRRQWRELKKNNQTRREALIGKVTQSVEKAENRRSCVPVVNYDDQLPVVQKKEDIAELIKQHQVVIVAGETGSGKTTQLPKLCLELGQGVFGLIGHTQPRRLAASAVATRIAEELNVPVGEQVGYQVRFNDQSGDNTLIKLMTDGVLLAEIQQDSYLNQYDTLIIDEAHERSLNIDFLLGYLKRLLPRRPDLKIIITSATIDVERFSRHFNNAPIIEVSGRLYPVETLYRPLEDLAVEAKDKDELQLQGIVSAVREIESLETGGHGCRLGDVLVFLSGEREIREASKRLRDEKFAHTEIFPLYARLSSAEQQRIFHPKGGGRRIILATNVAETSLTVPGIHYVIDPGFARISRYSVHSKVQRLPIEAISQASANQRKGRCGRIAEGICIRLYSEDDFNGRPAFTAAEILRTSLAAVILQMLSLRLGDIEAFPFLDMPESRAVNDGFKLLAELGAVNSHKGLTTMGRQLARLPVDPRMGRMLVEGDRMQALHEVLIIVSALSIQDPRERPADKRQAADEKHREFHEADSDFLTLVNLWQWYEEQRESLSQGQLRKLCKQQFIHFMRMREWRDMHRQLLLACKGLKLTVNTEEANYEAIHKSLLSGLLTHIGLRHDEADYQGVRNRRFWVTPGSSLYKKKPKWCMAAELVETSRLFARLVAKIEPQWIEPLAGELVKKNCQEPHWERKRSQVVATEQMLFYGLLIARRKVHYGPVSASEAREIFIRQALVEGDFNTGLSFFRKNQTLIEDVEALEDKARKRDILVDDEVLFTFYDEQIPPDVYSGPTLEKWLKSAGDEALTLLCLTKEYLLQRSADDINAMAYPDTLPIEGMQVPLSYVFDPAAADDGVTVLLPLPLLARFPEHRAAWLTPGLLHDKVVCLMRALPKQVRKNFIPVPQFASAVLEALMPCDEPLLPLLSEKLFRMTGMRVPEDAWNTSALDAHFMMNIRVLDEKGKVLGEGRDLAVLRKQFAGKAQSSGFTRSADKRWEKKGLTEWSFSELPESIEMKKAGLQFTSWPGLVDKGESVDLQLFESEVQAKYHTGYGLARLIMLRVSEPLKHMIRSLKQLDKICMLGMKTVSKQALVNDIQYAVVNQLFLQDETRWPKDSDAFNVLVESKRSDIVEEGERIEALLVDIFTRYHTLMKLLKKQVSFTMAFSMSDIKNQLQHLVYNGFLKDVPSEWLVHYPRYLRAIEIRLQKMGEQGRKDQLYAQELQTCWQNWCTRKEHLEKQQRYDNNLTVYRWMLEEYRVSLFAQALKTLHPVSAKRLEKLWETIVK